MSKKKSKKLNKDKRKPADKLILDFLKLHEIVLIADRQHNLENVADGLIYVISDKIRLRALYQDQIQTKNNNQEGVKIN